MRFIGVDLAWKLEPERASTAIAVLNERGSIIDHALVLSDEEVLKLVKRHCDNGCLVGIDAPLIVKNARGVRECDRALLKQRGIPSYPASRDRLTNVFGGIRGEKIVSRLSETEIRLRDRIEPRRKTKAALEVYPHASMFALFGRRINYKRGAKRERIAGMKEFIRQIQKLKPKIYLSEKTFSINPKSTISELKLTADLLDALLAAYTALLLWKYGNKRCEIFGDAERGFVVVPRRRSPDTSELAR